MINFPRHPHTATEIVEVRPSIIVKKFRDTEPAERFLGGSMTSRTWDNSCNPPMLRHGILFKQPPFLCLGCPDSLEYGAASSAR